MKCLKAPLVEYQKIAAILWQVGIVLSISFKNNVLIVHINIFAFICKNYS